MQVVFREEVRKNRIVVRYPEKQRSFRARKSILKSFKELFRVLMPKGRGGDRKAPEVYEKRYGKRFQFYKAIFLIRKLISVDFSKKVLIF